MTTYDWLINHLNGDSHSEGLLPLGAVGVVARPRLLGLAVHHHLHVGTGAEPVLPVLLELRRKH